jgi:hypothetical protein
MGQSERFKNTRPWLSEGFYDSHGTFFAHVSCTSSGANVIAVNDTDILVRSAETGQFGQKQTWSKTGIMAAVVLSSPISRAMERRMPLWSMIPICLCVGLRCSVWYEHAA